MELTENELRQLLFSPYGKNCGESLLSIPKGGAGITVRLNDGTTRVAKDSESVLLLLEEVFQWSPEKAA